jgi:hypothetical protein
MLSIFCVLKASADMLSELFISSQLIYNNAAISNANANSSFFI